MPGYANRIITLTFPELAEDGDHIEVVIRNPRLMPVDELRSAGDGLTRAELEQFQAAQQALAAGQPVPDGLVTDKDADRGFAMVAKLIIGWHVYDATSTQAEQPLLPLPATPELVRKLPMEILTRLMEEVGKVNPQKLPAGSTSRAS